MKIVDRSGLKALKDSREDSGRQQHPRFHRLQAAEAGRRGDGPSPQALSSTFAVFRDCSNITE